MKKTAVDLKKILIPPTEREDLILFLSMITMSYAALYSGAGIMRLMGQEWNHSTANFNPDDYRCYNQMEGLYLGLFSGVFDYGSFLFLRTLSTKIDSTLISLLILLSAPLFLPMSMAFCAFISRVGKPAPAAASQGVGLMFGLLLAGIVYALLKWGGKKAENVVAHFKDNPHHLFHLKPPSPVIVSPALTAAMLS